MSFLSNFFLKCSGVNNRILDEIPPSYLETEKTKFIGIGGAIFFTACLAFVSSSFALNTFVKDVRFGSFIIDKLVLCIGFGILWAVMIFNLDRYIVSSMRKKGNLKKELWHATPRIIIALLFAIVISKPLELEIFRAEIEAQLPKSADNQTQFLKDQIDSIALRITTLKSENDTLRKNPYNSEFVKSALQEFNMVSNELDSLTKESKPEIQRIERTINRLVSDYNSKTRRVRILYSRMDSIRNWIKENPDDYFNSKREEEINKITKTRNTLKNNRSRVSENITNQREVLQKIQDKINKKEEIKDDKSDYLATQKKDIGAIVKERIDKNKDTVEKLEIKLVSIEEERKKLNDLFTGLLARLKALDDLKSEKGNWIIFLASTLVFLIFVAIETAPVFVKLLSNQTLYDQILAEYEKPLPNLEILSAKVSRFYEEDANRLEKEKKALRKFYKQKLKIQKSFLAKSLNHMKEVETLKFEKNKDEFTSYVKDNPKEYLDSFKSKSSPLTEKGGKIIWEDEGEIEQSFFKNRWLKVAAITIGIISILMVGFFGLRYLFSSSSNNNEITKETIGKLPLENINGYPIQDSIESVNNNNTLNSADSNQVKSNTSANTIPENFQEKQITIATKKKSELPKKIKNVGNQNGTRPNSNQSSTNTKNFVDTSSATIIDTPVIREKITPLPILSEKGNVVIKDTTSINVLNKNDTIINQSVNRDSTEQIQGIKIKNQSTKDSLKQPVKKNSNEQTPLKQTERDSTSGNN